MITTAARICRGALRLIGAIQQGEPGDPDDISDAYEAIQEMLDQWTTNRLLCVVVEEADFALQSGVQSYTIGPGGDFNRQRPLWFERASILWPGNPTYPLELPLEVLDVGQWQGVPVKSTQSSLPTKVYYNFNGPLGTLKFYPVPTTVALQVRLYCPTHLTQFTSQTANYTFPPGYVGALRYNLAIALAPEYEREPAQAVAMLAAKYLAAIEMLNDHPEMIGVDAALVATGDRFNFYTGEPM